jgi:hypothetical protein
MEELGVQGAIGLTGNKGDRIQEVIETGSQG